MRKGWLCLELALIIYTTFTNRYAHVHSYYSVLRTAHIFVALILFAHSLSLVILLSHLYMYSSRCSSYMYCIIGRTIVLVYLSSYYCTRHTMCSSSMYSSLFALCSLVMSLRSLSRSHYRDRAVSALVDTRWRHRDMCGPKGPKCVHVWDLKVLV
jgi:hypothetical protein